MWLAGFLATMLAPVIVFFWTGNPKGLGWPNVTAYFEPISKAMLPTLLVITGYYFKERKNEMAIDSDASLIVILLFTGYLLGVLGTVLISTLSDHVAIAQDCVDPLKWTITAQPLIAAPVMYIFGKGSASARRSRRPSVA
jgi:ABC-type nitrate/sulfonate/bicarbonate transport system permease component